MTLEETLRAIVREEIRAALAELRPANDTDEIIPCRQIGRGWRRVADAVRRGELPGVRLDKRGTIGVRRRDVDAWRGSKPITASTAVAAAITTERQAGGDEFDRALASGRLRVLGGGRKR